MRKEECTELLQYNDWANARTLDGLVGLSPEQWTADLGGSFGSVQATAAHLVGAEWIWLRRWTGSSPSEPPAWLEGASAERLRDELSRIEAERSAWVESLREDDLVGELPYRFMSGESRQTQLGLLVRHLVNHSSYHRGQLATLLRIIGNAPLSTDLVVWDFQRRGI